MPVNMVHVAGRGNGWVDSAKIEDHEPTAGGLGSRGRNRGWQRINGGRRRSGRFQDT